MQINSVFNATHYNFRTYDQHSEKRRKRGSLFFRKKKDKEKEKEQRALERVHHVWGSTITQGCCDWCSKQLGTKPQVTCESMCSYNTFIIFNL